MISRENALKLLMEQGPDPHLVHHALESEAVMAALARILGRGEALWGLTGLLHDVDFPATKEDMARHGLACRDILGDALPEEALEAIAAHNDENTGVAPTADFHFALRAAESVTGLISAAALMRPTRMEGMSAKSLKKKMKDKSFAAKVKRENILECEKAGVPLDAFLEAAIAAITAIAPQVDLA